MGHHPQFCSIYLAPSSILHPIEIGRLETCTTRPTPYSNILHWELFMWAGSERDQANNLLLWTFHVGRVREDSLMWRERPGTEAPTQSPSKVL
jgi:hypothetical protein